MSVAEYAARLVVSATGGTGYLLKDRVLEPATLVDALRRVDLESNRRVLAALTYLRQSPRRT